MPSRMLLALHRRLVEADRLARCPWGEQSWLGGMGPLETLTLGLVGLGRIGRAMAERMRPLVGGIQAYDPASPALPDGVSGCDSLERAARRRATSSRCTCRCCPRRPACSARRNSRDMRPGALLVNVSRGGLIDEDALADALGLGQIGGAALDVFAHEPLASDARILQAPNTVLSPHVAWFSTASGPNGPARYGGSDDRVDRIRHRAARQSGRAAAALACRGRLRRRVMSAEQRYLVTGAYGCIGSWAVRLLLDEGCGVTTYDLGGSDHRLRLLLDDAELAALDRVRGDVTDLAQLRGTMEERGITHVIHLAALQVPFVRANPPLGASVNVVGTVVVFEAVRALGPLAGTLTYASSIAAYDPPEPGHEHEQRGMPSTLYGVFKRANEETAGVYWADYSIASIGLRPHTVYGLGRDQGVTSAPTKAMLAAAAGTSYRIPYGGRAELQHARDVARQFIAASRADGRGCRRCSIRPGGRPR